MKKMILAMVIGAMSILLCACGELDESSSASVGSADSSEVTTTTTTTTTTTANKPAEESMQGNADDDYLNNVEIFTSPDDVVKFETVIWTFHLFKHSDADLQKRISDPGILQTYGTELLSRAADCVMHHRRIAFKPLLGVVAAFIFYATEDSRPVEAGSTIITLLAVWSVKGYFQGVVFYFNHGYKDFSTRFARSK